MSYNGWKNYETWNVALWIMNDEGLYSIARWYDTYKEFVLCLKDSQSEIYDESVGEMYYQNPDGVAWNDSGLDIAALDEMIKEL